MLMFGALWTHNSPFHRLIPLHSKACLNPCYVQLRPLTRPYERTQKVQCDAWRLWTPSTFEFLHLRCNCSIKYGTITQRFAKVYMRIPCISSAENSYFHQLWQFHLRLPFQNKIAKAMKLEREMLYTVYILPPDG